MRTGCVWAALEAGGGGGSVSETHQAQLFSQRCVEVVRRHRESEWGVHSLACSVLRGEPSTQLWSLNPRQERPSAREKRAKARTEECLHAQRAATSCQFKKSHHRGGARRTGKYQEERFAEGEGTPERGHGIGSAKQPTSLHSSRPWKCSKLNDLKSL